MLLFNFLFGLFHDDWQVDSSYDWLSGLLTSYLAKRHHSDSIPSLFVLHNISSVRLRFCLNLQPWWSDHSTAKPTVTEFLTEQIFSGFSNLVWFAWLKNLCCRSNCEATPGCLGDLQAGEEMNARWMQGEWDWCMSVFWNYCRLAADLTAYSHQLQCCDTAHSEIKILSVKSEHTDMTFLDSVWLKVPQV